MDEGKYEMADEEDRREDEEGRDEEDEEDKQGPIQEMDEAEYEN